MTTHPVVRPSESADGLRSVLEAVAVKQNLNRFLPEPHDVSAFAVFDEHAAMPFELQAVPHDSRIAGASQQ